MKKLISLIALALCLSFSAFAQNDAIDLARQQQELNSVPLKSSKPSLTNNSTT